MTSPIKPQKDELDFLGPAQASGDSLDFLGSGDELDFLGPTEATPEPVAVAPVRDDELSPVLRLSDLAARPGISPTQKARIERLMHNQRRAVGEEQDNVDNLAVQAALTMAQGALALPTLAAKTAARITPSAAPAANTMQQWMEGIQPDIGPYDPQDMGVMKEVLKSTPYVGSLAQFLPDQIDPQAAIAATSQALGEMGGGVPLFKGVSAITGGVGQIAKSAFPRIAGGIDAAVTNLSGRVLARTGSEQLAKAITAAPKEMVAGTLFQALLDPESLKTPSGIAMAFLFGTLGAAGEGVRITKMVAAEKAAGLARDAHQRAPKKGDITEQQAAEIQLKITEAKADKAARQAGRKAWEAATPEMRRVLLPTVADDVLATNWKTLASEAREQIVAKLRVAASDSKLNTSKPPIGDVQPPAGGTPVLSAENIAGGTTDVPLTPGTTPRPSEVLPAKPQDATTPTSAPTPAALSKEEAIIKAQELIGRDGLTREVASVLKKRKTPPSTPEAMQAIVEAVARKIIDRKAAGGGKAATGVPAEKGKAGGSADVPPVPESWNEAVRDAEAPMRAEGHDQAALDAKAADDLIKSTDSDLTRLQTELEAERAARLQSERRANSAERAAELDDLTGLQNQNSWGKAQKRIDNDPNSHIILLDVKQFHAFNKRYGQAAGDELLRALGQGIRESLGALDQAFRVGGDEFAIVTTPEYAGHMKSKLMAVLRDQPIEGTPFTTGIRAAEGKTYTMASEAMVKVGAAETVPRSRPVDIVQPGEATSVSQKYISGDDALGGKLKEDIFDPGQMDEAGNNLLIAKSGEKLTARILGKITRAGIERFETSKGHVAIESKGMSGVPIMTQKFFTSDKAGKTPEQTIRRGTEADRFPIESKTKVGDPVPEKPPRPKSAATKAAEDALAGVPVVEKKLPPPGQRTIADIDEAIERLELLNDEGKLSDEKFFDAVNELGAEKRKLKPALPAQRAPITRGQLDYIATKALTPRQLDIELTTQLQALRGEQNPVARQAIMHDLGAVRREIRLRDNVKNLSDEALDTHASELKALWEELPVEQRGPIEARLGEVDAEFKKRRKPDITDMPFGEERHMFPGGLLREVDPLEAKAEPGLPPHSQRIQDRIVIDVQNDSPYPGLKDLMRGLKKLYSHAVRGTYAADAATSQLGLSGAPAVRNPGIWAELLSGSAGRAQRMLEAGPFRWLPDGNIAESGIKSYKQVLAPFRGRLNELRRFELSRYTIELLQRNRETGIDLLDAVREVNSAADDIKIAADESVAYRRGVLDYLTDGGMFSAEARAAVDQMTQAYVPLYRYMEGKDIAAVTHTVGAGLSKQGGNVGVGNQVKAMIGSLQKILDPIRSTVDQTRRFVRASDMNRLGVMLVEAMEANPEMARGLIWRETRVRTALDPSIAKQAEGLKTGAAAHGIKLTSEVAEELAIGLNSKRLRTRQDHLHVWRNGKREIFGISPELAEMYMKMQPHEMHWLVKALGFLPQMAKTGITDNPIFGFFNAWKDTFDAAAQSRYGFRWGLDSMIGFFDSVSNSKHREEFRAGAGTAGGIAGRAIGSLEQSTRAILPRTPQEKATALILHPIDALRELSVPFEEAARLGEFVRARQAGAPVMDAAIASQRVTTNFRQRGLSMEGLSHVVMFLNPALQSLDANIRTVARQPGKLGAVLFASVTLPSMYLWAANKEDKEIEELRKSRFGSGFWFYRKNDGRIGRVPKPFLYGAIFGTGAEDALDAMYDKDPTAGDRFIQTLVDQIPYNVVPTVMNFTLGLIYNKDFSSGSPIAPDNLESGTGEVEPRYQSRPETGPTARSLGNVLNVSPAKIEFAVRTATGTLGQDVLRGIDMINNAKAEHPAPMDAEFPVVGRMLAKYPSAGAFNLRLFYDEARKVEVAVNTSKLLEKDKPERLSNYMDNHRREIALSEVYSKTRKELATLRSQTDYIASLPATAMSPEQKRVLINFTVDKMIQMARETNLAIRHATEGIDFSPRFAGKKPTPKDSTGIQK